MSRADALWAKHSVRRLYSHHSWSFALSCSSSRNGKALNTVE